MRTHGTYACYVWGPEPGQGDGCRCDACKAANSCYEADRARQIAPAYVGASTARTHVRELMAAGVGLKTIAKVSGVGHGTLWKLIYGVPGRGPTKRVRPTTESRLLAVSPADQAAGARRDAAPTLTNIATLTERGWSRGEIARQIGQKGPGLQIGTTAVTARQARAIAGLLDEPVPPRKTRWGAREVTQPDPAPDLRPDPCLPDLTSIDEPWRERAACAAPDIPTWMFYPGRGDSRTVEAARAVCARCPVRDECLQAALADPSHLDYGIRGGTTVRQRRSMRWGNA